MDGGLIMNIDELIAKAKETKAKKDEITAKVDVTKITALRKGAEHDDE